LCSRAQCKPQATTRTRWTLRSRLVIANSFVASATLREGTGESQRSLDVITRMEYGALRENTILSRGYRRTSGVPEASRSTSSTFPGCQRCENSSGRSRDRASRGREIKVFSSSSNKLHDLSIAETGRDFPIFHASSTFSPGRSVFRKHLVA